MDNGRMECSGTWAAMSREPEDWRLPSRVSQPAYMLPGRTPKADLFQPPPRPRTCSPITCLGPCPRAPLTPAALRAPVHLYLRVLIKGTELIPCVIEVMP